jgi:hypothetical protein
MGVHGRLRQEDHELKASLGYVKRPCLNKKEKFNIGLFPGLEEEERDEKKGTVECTFIYPAVLVVIAKSGLMLFW